MQMLSFAQVYTKAVIQEAQGQVHDEKSPMHTSTQTDSLSNITIAEWSTLHARHNWTIRNT